LTGSDRMWFCYTLFLYYFRN